MEIKKQYLPKVAKFQPKKITPSPEQLVIQLATQKTVLIDANAGAAKTTTLALRIAESLARGVAAEQVLALCVTEAAQQVLRQRLKDIGLPLAQVKKIRCETFESFARQVLVEIEQISIPYFEDQNELKPLAMDALYQVSEFYGERFALDIQTHNLAFHNFFRMQTDLKSRMKLSLYDFEGYLEEEIAHVLWVPLTDYLWFLEYEKFRDRQFRGPGDAAYDLVKLLHEDPDFHRDLPQYRLILADELHDLNEVTFRLLSALIQNSGAYFCGAGDKDQVIYSWQGADHQYLRHRFSDTFPNIETYPLTLCFRHGPVLADAVARFKNKTNQSGVTLETEIERVRYSASHGASAVLASLKKYHKAGGDLHKCAILLRSPAQSIQIEYELILASMSYKMDGIPKFFQRLEILMLRGMMALGMKDLHQVASVPVRRMIFEAMPVFTEIELDQSQQKAWENIVKTAIEQPNALDWFFSGVLIEKSKPQTKQRLIECRDYLRALPADTMVAEVLERVCELLRLREITKRVFIDPQQARAVQESFDEFIALCSVRKIQLQDFSKWLGDIEKSVTSRNVVELTIACVDDIKGKEYNAVFLPYLEQGEFPRHGMPLLEEENRFYVAITRAREHLTLFLPDDTDPTARPSDFLRRMKKR